jgi:hypothetical protein
MLDRVFDWQQDLPLNKRSSKARTRILRRPDGLAGSER